MIVRTRHPLRGMSLQVLGRMRRHGVVEFLVVLPDGSKKLIPAGFTDAVPAAAQPMPVTVGSVQELVQLTVVVASLVARAAGAGVVGDATGIPAKEDTRASDQSADVRPRGGVGATAGAAGDRGATGRVARPGSGGGGAQAGDADREAPRRDRAGR